jgi:peptidoglycan/xylan/chitin deacetylase (PgdA/CDA1 family)
LKRKVSAAAGLVLALLILAWVTMPRGYVPILAYHMVNDVRVDNEYCMTTSQFDEQMKYLSEEGYTAISMREFFEARGGKRTLPDKPVIITFDDGYKDNLTEAQPILEKYGMKGTVFVATGLVDTDWYLTPAEIKELSDRGMEIGSHTVSHVPMTGDVDIHKELGISRMWLEQTTGKPCIFFAYPFGAYNDKIQKDIQAYGYWGSVTGDSGYNDFDVPRHQLKRVNMPKITNGLTEFKNRLRYAYLRTWLRL